LSLHLFFLILNLVPRRTLDPPYCFFFGIHDEFCNLN
jgi:hypothetical protein